MTYTRSKYLMIAFLSSLLFLLQGCDTDNVVEEKVLFKETYRPQFHYTPERNWMNDPNGLVYNNGKYHLFHQYNPLGNRWGHMSWGHAVSDDLVHWEHKPVAIMEEGNEMIFSGSAVIDHQNSSGFGDGDTVPMVAVYTSHYTLMDDSVAQAQSLAYSLDGGETFTKYAGNPVLEFDDPDFRDPNVKWNEEMEQWLMVVALPQQHKVQFYASDNLIDWEFLSDFGPAGAIGGIWECPDFFALPVDGNPDNIKWVLHVDMNPGSVAGGSGSQYFIGEWNGTEFTPDETVTEENINWVDYGTDFYAAISWNNIPEEDGRRMWVGWMNNWDYANEIPTEPWKSAQSIPRSLELKTSGTEIKLFQEPVEELKKLRTNHQTLQNMQISSDEISLSEHGMSGKSFEIVIELAPGEADNIGLKVRKGETDETVVGYDRGTGSVYVDRTNSGESDFYDDFAKRNDVPVSLDNDTLKLHIYVDWSSVEVFVNDGEYVFTNRIFPDPESREITLFSENGNSEIIQLDFWTLNSIWD